jgi:predicted MPP superfamily phosphohydrolase
MKTNLWPPPDLTQELIEKLETRLGRTHARQRLGIERDYEAYIFGQGINFFHIENWYSIHSVIRNALKVTGLYWRGRRNADNVQVRHHRVKLPNLPPAFDGFTILHLSDLHVDISAGAMQCLIKRLEEGIHYDICVLTGDFRGNTFGPFQSTLEGLARVRAHLKDPVYGVLGNHDTVCLIPGMEDMGIRMLLNESDTLVRANQRIHLAGIDDAHYYRVDNIEKVASQFDHDAFSILLSHTPEVYRQAAHAGFNLMLSGHTHGGQICLPGSIPITLDSVLPRRMGSGSWTYHDMVGYTSVGAGSVVVPVRLNCLPEITLHHLICAEPPQPAGGQ